MCSQDLFEELRVAVDREDVATQERLFLQMISKGEAQLHEESSRIKAGSPIEDILSNHVVSGLRIIRVRVRTHSYF